MFQYTQENDDQFLFEDLPFLQDDKILEDLLAEDVVDQGNAHANDLMISTITEGEKKKKRKTSVNNICEGVNIINEEKKGEGSNSSTYKESKKVMHRVVERQRRQDMAELHASLRSLLPLEYIKGKRSVCDHMDEAAKFIKHMEAKIEGMRKRRDKINKLSSGVDTNNIISDNNCVKVNQLLGEELEILISCGQCFPLSKLLLELLGMGLNVVSCLSSRGNEQSIHKIQIQASSNFVCDDLSDLQQRLANIN